MKVWIALNHQTPHCINGTKNTTQVTIRIHNYVKVSSKLTLKKHAIKWIHLVVIYWEFVFVFGEVGVFVLLVFFYEFQFMKHSSSFKIFLVFFLRIFSHEKYSEENRSIMAPLLRIWYCFILIDKNIIRCKCSDNVFNQKCRKFCKYLPKNLNFFWTKQKKMVLNLTIYYQNEKLWMLQISNRCILLFVRYSILTQAGVWETFSCIFTFQLFLLCLYYI